MQLPEKIHNLILEEDYQTDRIGMSDSSFLQRRTWNRGWWSRRMSCFRLRRIKYEVHIE